MDFKNLASAGGALMELPILVIPNQRPGQGGGHLVRCGALVQELRAAGIEAYLYSNGPLQAGLFKHRDTEGSVHDLPVVDEAQAQQKGPWRFVVIDGFRTDPSFFHAWAHEYPVVGIDEGGPCRSCYDYLVDILPGPKQLNWRVRFLMLMAPFLSSLSFFKKLCIKAGNSEGANQISPEYLKLPLRRREQLPGAIHKILVSFGAEDAQGLSVPVLESLLASGYDVDISLVIGPKNRTISSEIRNRLVEQGVHILDAPDTLAESFWDYDLVITHFGLTAFEALSARAAVALVSPSRYHEILSLSAQFYSFGYGQAAARHAGRLLAHQSVQKAILQQSSALHQRFGLSRRADTFASVVQGWTFPTAGRCPLCHDRKRRKARILARFPDRTYVRCGSCGITYMIRPQDPPITYDGAYFLEDYKKQYGKTYIEDFPNLVRMAQSRLEQIQRLLLYSRDLNPENPVRLLDIGCAYGPFLAAARVRGWNPIGLDPSSDAVRHVQTHVGVPVLQGLFPETDLTALLGGEQLDVVSLWYVIEHFPDLGKALEAAATLLKKGGVFAFSTPSLSGISGRARLRSFLEHSPPDHWTILSPKTCGPVLARYGLRLVKTVNTGHHPERFPLLGPFAKSKKTVIYKLLFKVSQLFSLGDTFEAYAVKE
jgi:2-polyprenyl-3-methyl-5-hydroxy-6-metoxy-1,4-benzoquinol methylase/spore coat polysaccharide biosynthesis predicted glycosyltransferase SpsG